MSIPNANLYKNTYNLITSNTDILLNIESTQWFKSTELQSDPSELQCMELFTAAEEIFASLPKNVFKDESMQRSLDSINLIVQNTVQDLMQNISWTFNTKDKLNWICLLISAHNSPALIKHFLTGNESKNESDKLKIIFDEDKNGNNCILHACFDINCVAELINQTSKDIIFKPNSRGLSAVDMMISNGTLLQLIDLNLISINDILAYKSNTLNIFHIITLLSSSTILKYLIDNSENCKELLMEYDCNKYTPVSLACSYEYYELVDLYNTFKFFDDDVIKQCIVSPSKKSTLYSYMDSYIKNNKLSDQTIIDNYQWFCNYFIKQNFANLDILVNSNYFKPEILHINEDNSLISQFININYKSYVLKLTDDKKEIIYSTIKKFPVLFHKLVKDIPEMANIMITNDLTIDLIDNSIIYETLMKYYTIYDLQMAQLYLSIAEKLINLELFDTKYLTTLVAGETFIQFIFRNIPNAFTYLLTNNKLIDLHISSIQDILLQSKDDTQIKEMIKMNIINKNTFKINGFNILKASFTENPKLTYLFLDESDKLFDSSIFIKDNTSLLEDYGAIKDPELFTKLITHKLVTPDTINYINNEGYHFMCYIHNDILDVEKLDILIKSRKDFDHNILFNTCMIEFICDGRYDMVNYMLTKYKTITYESYCKSFCYLLEHMSDLHDRYKYISLFLNHEHFDDKILELTVNTKYVLHILIECNMPELDIILDKYMSERLYNLKQSTKNILMICLESGGYLINNILNSKFINKSLFTDKYSDDKTIIELIHSNASTSLATNILNYMVKHDYLTCEDLLKYSEHGTLCNQLSMYGDGHHAILFSWAKKYKNKNILLTTNHEYLAPLYKLCTYTKADIKAHDFIDIGITFDDICQKNANNKSPITELAKNMPVLFNDLIKIYITNKDMLLRNVYDGESKPLLIYGTNIVKNFIDNIPYEFISDKSILEYKYNGMPFVFQIDHNYQVFEKLLLDNKINLLTEYNNKTYLEFIIPNIKTELLTTLFNMSIEVNPQCNNNIILPEYINQNILNLLVKYHPSIINSIINDETYIIIRDQITSDMFIELLINSIKQNIDDLENSGFAVLASCKLFNKDILLHKVGRSLQDSSKSFLEYLYENQLYFEFLMKKSIIPHDILYSVDQYGDLLLTKLRYNLDDFGNILKYVSKEHIIHQNKCGQTIMHLFANDKCFPNIIADISDNLMLNDNFGKSCIDYVVENHALDNMDYLIDNKILKSYMLEHVDKSNKTLLSKILVAFPDNHLKLSTLLTDNVLNVTDSDGITNLGYIIMYSNELLEWYLTSNLSKKILDKVDNNGRTCTMIAAQHNIDNLRLLLKNNNIEEKHLMVHKNLGSCLSTVIRFHPKAIRYILDSDKMNDKLIESRENDSYFNTIINMNIVQLACKYSDEALMFICSSKYDVSNLVEETVGKSNDLVNSLKLAIIYQPDCTEYLLKSKYCTDTLINNTNKIMIKSCSINALDYQLGSFIKIAKSNKFKHIHMTYNQLSPINQLIDTYYLNLYDDGTDAQYDKIADILLKKFPLIKNTDEFCTSSDKDACNMCCMKKNKVFLNCGHKACIACSTKIYKCHMCRTQITQRLQYD
jgi:hypothetical protein